MAQQPLREGRLALRKDTQQFVRLSSRVQKRTELNEM